MRTFRQRVETSLRGGQAGRERLLRTDSSVPLLLIVTLPRAVTVALLRRGEHSSGHLLLPFARRTTYHS